MSLNEGFNDRMQRGKDLARTRSNRGFSERTTKSWAKPPLAEDTAENRLYAELADLRRELRDRDNTIALLRANGGHEPELDSHEAEFDRLLASGKKAGAGLPPDPLAIEPRASFREEDEGSTMTPLEYTTALKKLGLSVASKRTVAALGLSLRQIQKFPRGHAPVPDTVAKLLSMYLEHGLPEEHKPLKLRKHKLWKR